MSKKVAFPIIIIVFLSACTGYQKVLKSDDSELKYSKAIEYYENEDYARAMTIFEDLVPVYRGTDRADDIQYYYAYCQYHQNDYILAGYYFRNFAQTYPKSKYAQDCQFMGAYCYYLDSPRACLDQSNTYSAIKELQLYISRYPKSDRVEKCNTLIDALRHKLEKKSYDNAKLYYDLGYYKAAGVALQNSLEEYPDSDYREKLLYYLVKSYFELAENSIIKKQEERYKKTLKFYEKFKEEFPESKYDREINKIHKKTKKALETFAEISDV